MKIKQLLIVVALLIGFSACQAIENNQINKPNILFIAVDDLRPELGCYGKSWIKSPNIDALASEGIVFQHAYCNIPVCGASRASILSGIYPTRTKYTTYFTRVDEDMPGIVTLPQNFKESGYQTFSFGKVFHHLDDAAVRSWSETPWRPDFPKDIYTQEGWRDYQSGENKDKSTGAVSGPAWEKADVRDDAYYDGKTANKVVDKLRTLANSEKPFFVAVGFLKTHLPFNAPAKYWNIYSHNEIELAPNLFFPENAPKQAKYNFEELRSYSNMPKGDTLVNNEQARWLKHGYFACVSYTDAMIGKVLNRNIFGMLDPADLRTKIVKPGLWFFPQTPDIDNDGCANFDPMYNAGLIKLISLRSFDATKNYLWPIPTKEVLINQNLKQNPGY